MRANNSTKAWTTTTFAASGLLSLSLFLSTADAQPPLLVDFDGGDTTAHHVTSSSGAFTPTVQTGGPTGNYLRLIDLTESNNNTVAFDEVAAVSGPAPNGKVLSWDFRMSNDGATTAADGFGIGYFAAAAYGATGPSNPSADTGIPWERPAIPSAAVIGFDVYEDIDVVTLNFGGAEMTAVDVRPLGLDLNNNVFHRGIFTVRPNPADTTKSFFSVDVIEDVHGANPVMHQVLDDFPMDFDLSTIGPNRVIAGGRTGGAFVNVDLDNITVQKIPEPSSLVLAALAALGLPAIRRRRPRS